MRDNMVLMVRGKSLAIAVMLLEVFCDLLETHKGMIFKITSSYCKDPTDRQDLTQEIIIQLWQSLEHYDPKFRVSTWMYRVALNTAISFYRKNKRRKEQTASLPAIFESTIQAEEPYQEDPNLQKLKTIIQDLKEINKAIIILHLDGLNHQEIAEIMGISTTNVSTKLSRIKKVIRQKFNLKNNSHHE